MRKVMTLLKAASLAWKAEMVWEEVMITVGEMPDTAASKETSSPETEFRATEAFEQRAARVMQRG